MDLGVSFKSYLVLSIFVLGIPLTTMLPAAFLIPVEKVKHVILSILGIIFLIYVALCFSISSNRISVEDDQLKISSLLYSYSTKLNEGNIEYYAGSLPKELQIQRKINGINLPGYHLGWFRLANGKRAFILQVGDSSNYSVFKGKHEYMLVNHDISKLLSRAKR